MTLQDFTGHTVSLPASGLGKHFVVKNIVDCYNSVANGGFGTFAVADLTAKVLEVHEGWLVKRVYTRIIKLGTAATSMDTIGDSIGGAAVWSNTALLIGSSGTLNQARGTLHTDTNGALNGYLFLADAYIYITISVADYDGQAEFSMEVIDVFGDDTIV